MPIFSTIELAKKIIESLAKWTGKKLERNHKVLKLLKAIGIGALEDKFDSIYNHTLVEYAVDANPIELTLLFAAKDVKKAFQQGLCKDDRTELEKALEKQLHSNKKLAILTHIYKNAKDLEPEIEGFRNLYDYFTMQAANKMKPGSEKAICDEKSRVPLFFPLRLSLVIGHWGSGKELSLVIGEFAGMRKLRRENKADNP